MAAPLWFQAADTEGRVSAYREFRARGPARKFAACAWEGLGGWKRAIRVLPDGCVDLVWTGEALRVAAARPYARTYALSPGSRSIGLRLRCATAGAVLGLPADRLPDTPLRLAEIWGREIRDLEDELARATPAGVRERLERLVTVRLTAGDGPDRQVVEAVRLLGEPGMAVDAAAEAVGLAPRELRRRTRREVGYGPKTLQRVLRFKRFHGLLGDIACGRIGLAVAAHEVGYADQSHLSRQCRELTGSTPLELVRGVRA